jgi:hypothetical protein
VPPPTDVQQASSCPRWREPPGRDSVAARCPRPPDTVACWVPTRYFTKRGREIRPRCLAAAERAGSSPLDSAMRIDDVSPTHESAMNGSEGLRHTLAPPPMDSVSSRPCPLRLVISALPTMPETIPSRPIAGQIQPPPGNARNKNPSVSHELTEGLRFAGQACKGCALTAELSARVWKIRDRRRGFQPGPGVPERLPAASWPKANWTTAPGLSRPAAFPQSCSRRRSRPQPVR